MYSEESPSLLQFLGSRVAANFAKESEDLYACVWTKDLATGSPLLCVAGREAVIHVIDVVEGAEWRVL